MTDSKFPLVLLIDLDGTIQGDIFPQLREYNLLKALNLKISSEHHLHKDYEKGLLRPYFKEFIQLIKKLYTNKVELFIYTASEKKWANFVVPIIESIIGFKFNRPFFTRNDCHIGPNNETTKSIKQVRKHVIQSLKHKYKDNNVNLEDRIYLIDNNYVLNGDPGHLIKCPTYEKAVFINVLRNVPDQVLTDKYTVICKTLINGKSCSNKWEMMKVIYDDAFKKYILYENKNEPYNNDKYWKKVIRVFTKYPYRYTSIIKHLKTIS
jgi:hypothetical protein